MTRSSDRQLIDRLETLAARERDAARNVQLYLDEVERRGLHLSLGYTSIMEFATKHLGLSESDLR